ncbi:hypothetical protein KM043_016415 [Ampulex compressa]|nr:hypothetical protein KM043_016415 [Ampulex compressa]
MTAVTPTNLPFGHSNLVRSCALSVSIEARYANRTAEAIVTELFLGLARHISRYPPVPLITACCSPSGAYLIIETSNLDVDLNQGGIGYEVPISEALGSPKERLPSPAAAKERVIMVARREAPISKVLRAYDEIQTVLAG